ncbi:MAG TPA: type IV-A pilus assembly ATPase PilB [Polyangia bacterium]|jgi:type IV pilus assembly protein PilB|nr:type IV-A pilus assembly ATPase PilB [Polyangia bacterium]
MSRLGELLVREQVISAAELQKAQETSKRTREPLRDSLIKLGVVKEDDLTQFLAKQYGVTAINLAEFDIEAEVIALIPKDVARKQRVIPVNRADKTLIVAMSDPSNIQALDDLKFLTGYNIEVVVASEVSIADALAKYYEEKNDALNFNLDEMLSGIDEDVEFAKDESEAENVLDLERASEDAPVVKLCNAILLNAIKQGASDIHIEPYEKSYRVRYRVDGVMHEEMNPPLKLKAALTSRMKIMAHLDIAERRLPQDGRIKLKIGRGKEMDFRVSVLPTLFGEKIVLRLLDKGNLQLDMTKLGFEQGQLALFKKAIDAPFGMVLVTGPTGSGKTTTLYSALQELNQITDNISTAEDPVEFNLAGINQVQMHDDIGLNFAAALRSFLRQDPDTIMIGEIRDFETAEIAVKAALTGHLVLSTLHTNDAPSTITRLLNMGVEPFLVTASVNLVEAQRLIRKICAGCKEPIPTPKEELRNLGAKDEEIETATCFKGVGCNICGGSGYKGRIAVYEVMTFIDPLKELVLQGASGAEMKAEAIRHGMRTLRMSGVSKICAGVSSVDEVARITAAD